MKKIERFEDMKVWQGARGLTPFAFCFCAVAAVYDRRAIRWFRSRRSQSAATTIVEFETPIGVTRLIYGVSGAGSFSKDFTLKDQARRAAVSIMANIADGFERGGDKEFAQFLSLAKASCGELRSHLYVAYDQKYLSLEEFERLRTEAEAISRMLASFMSYLRSSNIKGIKFKSRAPKLETPRL